MCGIDNPNEFLTDQDNATYPTNTHKVLAPNTRIRLNVQFPFAFFVFNLTIDILLLLMAWLQKLLWFYQVLFNPITPSLNTFLNHNLMSSDCSSLSSVAEMNLFLVGNAEFNNGVLSYCANPLKRCVAQHFDSNAAIFFLSLQWTTFVQLQFSNFAHCWSFTNATKKSPNESQKCRIYPN